MKIVILAPSYPSPYCGIATYTDYYATAMRKVADVDILGKTHAATPAALLQNAARRAEVADVIHVQHAYDLYGYMSYQVFSLYRTLAKSRKPIVTTVHELPEKHSRSIKSRLAFPYLRQVLKTIVHHSTIVLVHSEGHTRLLNEWTGGNNIRFIQHGTIEYSSFKERTLPIADKSPKFIGFFGFIMPHKGIHRVIEALPALPDVTFRIAGRPRTKQDEAYLAYLKEIVRRLSLGDRVEFLGFIPDEEMAAFFAQIDVVVFPYSHCTASGALHLALAHGSVMLASRIDKFHEIKVQYDCLEEFELDRPETLVSQLKLLLNDDVRRSELVAGCRRMIEATSWSAIAKQTSTIFRTALEGDSSSDNHRISS